MAVFYLKVPAAGGNDANDGASPLRPWATVAKAAQRIWQPGDVLLISPGTYPATAGLEWWGGGEPGNKVAIRTDGGPALIDWGDSRQDAWKFNVSGVGFVVAGLRGTQDERGGGASDRMFVAQVSDDGQRRPSDVEFRGIVAWEGYELFKASAAHRIRFVGCEGHDATIAGGIVGEADDCAFEECVIWDCGEGLQAKGGCRNPRILRCTIAAIAGGNAITLGGASVIHDGSDPEWWRDDGYESSHAITANNVIVGVPGVATNAAVMIQGAKHARAANNTVISLDGTVPYQDGIETAFDHRTGGGANWTGGNPTSADVVIENNLVYRCATSVYTRQDVGGSNAYRNNTHYLTNWVTTADDLGGEWAFAGNATRDPGFQRVAGIDDWREIDARLMGSSPERGSGSAVAHAGFGGEEIDADRGRDGGRRGKGGRDRGAFDESGRRERRRRRARLWRAAA